ncbi:protein FAM200C-like [Oratosquilla oratoria]|uniref:protein FAM200C-like n=1 Tax=Oratosquilla oratoria TaxID=337810 RepID=UPI003F760E5D
MAKAKKPHSIGETLIKPCLVSCAGILLGESAVSKMKQVSLSNDTVKSRIFDMSCNTKSQLLAKVKASPVFAIQLDESVDVANLSQLIVFVRYVHDQSIEEDLLFCRPLETTTQAADVMQLVEVTQFLEQRNKGDLKAAVSDEVFQCRLAFLADMFSHLNELNRKLQGVDSDIIGHRDKVNAFVSKLELWRGKFETGRSATVFPTLARISETASGVSDVLKNEVIIHLNRLLDEFQHYFPDFKSDNPMMVDNFPKEAEDIEEQFLDLVHDSAAKAVFAEKSLNAFWATMHGSYPRVAVAALTLLVAFPSTYLCESAFSSMVEIKTKSRNRLIDLESDLRCTISKVEPNIEALVKAKQMQKSH